MHILFDLGKTKIRVAGSTSFESFIEPRIFDTPKDYENTIKLIAETAREIAKGSEIELVAGGIGGPLNKEKDAIIERVNTPGWEGRPFPGWGGKPFRDDLSAALNAKVLLENDSALVGLGEAVYGAGKNSDIVAYITVSTGLGGARIVDGKIDRNALGFEPGWQVLSLEDEGCYASDFLTGYSVEMATGKKPYETTDPMFWDGKAHILAHFLNNVIVMWSPDVVVIGGSMMKEIGIPIPTTEKYLRHILKICDEIPPIKKAELQDIGGLWGALEFLKLKKREA
ncbi:MAG: ROK family protein [Candidatus Paceibacterota bacterium]|jgi:glucokinase